MTTAGGPFLGLPDGLGCGELGRVVADDLGEDDFGVDEFRFLAGYGLAGGDVGGVGLSSSGHPDVQGAAVQGAGDEQVGGAGGPALGDVGVARVGQLAVVGEVPLGYQERAGPAAVDLAPYLYLAMD